MSSPRTLARVAGLLYLMMFVCATFAGSVRSRIIDSSDPAATANNIRSSATLFRVGFVADLMQATFLLLAAMALYLLLRHVDGTPVGGPLAMRVWVGWCWSRWPRTRPG